MMNRSNPPPPVFGSFLGDIAEGIPVPTPILSHEQNLKWELLQLSKQTSPPAGWATVADAARFFGWSTQNLRSVYLPQLEPEDVRHCRPALVRVGALVDIVVERRLSERSRSTAPGDPLLSGGDSPGLERYRLAKAQHAELDLAERRGQVIDVAKCRDTLGRWAAILRRAGERVGKLHPDAGRTLADALDECRSVVSELDDQGGDR
jgi:hypothetical protein